jgi:hypothetical protein
MQSGSLLNIQLFFRKQSNNTAIEEVIHLLLRVLA